jgi:hypothetical protein
MVFLFQYFHKKISISIPKWTTEIFQMLYRTIKILIESTRHVNNMHARAEPFIKRTKNPFYRKINQLKFAHVII